jgi:Tol biopolymer transport system component
MIGYDLDAAVRADWSPDGERIVFTGVRTERNTLCLIRDFLPLSPPAEPEPPGEPERKEMTVRMVWSGDKVDGSGKVSPDGEFLPFIDWETGNLAVRQLASGETRYLTDDGGWDYPMRFADQPVVSPDGELIAYIWWADADPSGEDSGTYSGDLCLINSDGTNRRVLVDAGIGEEFYASSFAPDGAHIAVHLYDSTGQQLALVSTGDGSLQILKAMGDRWNWTSKMDFSADGQYLVYDVTVEGAPANKDIFLLPVDGSGEVPLVQHPANDQLLGRVPGSNLVLFLSDRSGNWDAWVVEVVDGRPMYEPQLVRKNMGDIWPMGLTRDSAFYYDVHTRWLTASTGRIDSVTGKIVTPLQEPLAGSGGVLSWSPDGEYVAFVAEQSAPTQPGGREDILYVRSVSTGQQRELSSQHNRVSNRVHWSPDSRYLLVRGIDAGDLYGSGPTPSSLSLIDVETGDETLIVHGISFAGIGGVWSPDGKSIYYFDRDSLVRRDLTSERQEVVYRGESRLRSWLALSPNGEQLLVGVRRDSCDCILVLSVSSGETRELFRNTKSDVNQIQSFEWMPDGRHVLFILKENPNEGPTSLWRIPAEGGTAEKTLHSRKRLSGLSVHPDGHQVSFTDVKLSSEIWVMENFLPED